MIVRPASRARYTVVDNQAVEDPALSFKALGVLVYVLSKPDTWQVSYRHLATTHPDGEHAVRTALAELEAAGYIERRREQDPETGLMSWVQIIHETPTMRGEPPHGATRDDADHAAIIQAREIQARETTAVVTTERGNTQEQLLAPAAPDAPAPARRPPDLLWDAMLAVCGISDPIPRSARGAYNRAVTDLRAIGATPDEIHRRGTALAARWGPDKLTPSSLARHWAEFHQPTLTVSSTTRTLAAWAQATG